MPCSTRSGEIGRELTNSVTSAPQLTLTILGMEACDSIGLTLHVNGSELLFPHFSIFAIAYFISRFHVAL